MEHSKLVPRAFFLTSVGREKCRKNDQMQKTNKQEKYNKVKTKVKNWISSRYRFWRLTSPWVSSTSKFILPGSPYLVQNYLTNVVSLSIFTSCAVFWRARKASQNTNNEIYKRFIIQHAKLVL